MNLERAYQRVSNSAANALGRLAALFEDVSARAFYGNKKVIPLGYFLYRQVSGGVEYRLYDATHRLIEFFSFHLRETGGSLDDAVERIAEQTTSFMTYVTLSRELRESQDLTTK